MNLPRKIDTDEVICQCHQVKESTIRNAISAERLNDIDSVTKACEAGGGCYSCHILIQVFIDEHKGKPISMEDLVHDHGQKVKKKGILSRFFNKFQ